MFVQGTRPSENLYLIHNLNSICRLSKLILNIFPEIPIIGLQFPTKFFERALRKELGRNSLSFIIDSDYLEMS